MTGILSALRRSENLRKLEIILDFHLPSLYMLLPARVKRVKLEWILPLILRLTCQHTTCRYAHNPGDTDGTIHRPALPCGDCAGPSDWALFIGIIYVWAKLDPKIAPRSERYNWREKLSAFAHLSGVKKPGLWRNDKDQTWWAKPRNPEKRRGEGA